MTTSDPFATPETEVGGFAAYIPPFFRRGSEFWRWVSLIVLNAVTVLGIGLLVVGTGLVGAGLAILASGFGLVDVGLTSDLGTALAVGLVVSLIGAFATGLAVEGPVGYKVRRFEARPWEVAVTTAPGFFIAAWAAARLASLADRLLERFPDAFDVVGIQLRAVGETALGWPLVVAVVLLFAVHQFAVARFPKLEYQAHGVIYVVWLLAAISAYALFS